MGFEEEVSAVLQRFPDIDREYLDTAFHNYYVDYGAPTETLADLCDSDEGSDTVISLLEDTGKILVTTARTNNRDLFWDLAIELDRSERYLLGVVYMGVSQALASVRIADKIVGLLSCQLYLSLMLVPKTGVNLLFPSLLQSCLSMLSLPPACSNVNSISLGSPDKRRSRNISSESRGAAAFDDESYPVETLENYISHISEVLDSLAVFLTNVSLEEHDDVISTICQHMATLTENDMLCSKAYNVLRALCDTPGLHGDVSELLKIISFRLNGNLLMLRAGLKDQVPRAMVKARDSSIRFLLCQRDQVETDERLLVTIQQLAMRSLEKSDIRFRTAEGVLQLLLRLEEDSLTRTLHWFHKLIRSKLPRHRLFALELFGQICGLQNPPPVLRNHLSNIALAALERVTDELASVKAKAFAFFAQLTNTPQWMDNLVTNECSHEDVIGALLGILNECVKDSKVHVRKSALNVLNSILCGDTEFDKGAYVDVIVRCCRDQTILVRKHALECLLKVYRRHPCYYKEFVSGVFPLTMDNEPSVQEKALFCVLDVVFDSILPGRDADSGWNVLRHLGTYERYLPSICEQLCRKEGKIQLERQHIQALVAALNTTNASLAWKLLSYLCNHIKVDLTAFDASHHELDDDAECCRLSVLLTQSQFKKDTETYLNLLLTRLNSPTTSFMQLGHVCSILLHLDKTQLVQWAEATFPECVRVMQNAADHKEFISEEDLLSAMFKAGECVLVLTNAADLHLCTLLRTIVQDQTRQLSVRRMALRVLGQISLVSVDLAKRLVSLIGDTVDNADDLSLRVIGIRTVADLSCRYATLTDQLLPVVYCLLKDPEIEVRRAAIINLLQLLKEEYIKLRNNFLYHLLECVLDEDEMLRDLSEFGLDQFVLKRNPNLYLQIFIDCVFHLNAYRGHSLYNQAFQTSREIQTFSLVGQPGKRQMIYRFMVRRLTEEHKFLLTLNICNNVLKAIVDNETAIDRECPAIVIDLLEVLSLDELRLRVSSRADEEEVGGVETTGDDAAPTTATPSTRHRRKKEQFILNAIKLKTMIETILPPLTMLKTRCEDNEELMTALMSYLNVLNHEYKNELKSLLVGDSASEFYKDLKKFEATRLRLDETNASTGTNEDPLQESKMKLIMKVLQSARKQQRAILDRDKEPVPSGATEPAEEVPRRSLDFTEVPEVVEAAENDAPKPDIENTNESNNLENEPAEKDSGLVDEELSGFEPLPEQEVPPEDTPQNGILVDASELDDQQPLNGDMVNGHEGESPPSTASSEDVEQSPREDQTSRSVEDLEQNGLDGHVNGHRRSRSTSRRKRERAEHEVAEESGHNKAKKMKVSKEPIEECDEVDGNLSRKRRRSASSTSSVLSRKSRRLCNKEEAAVDDQTEKDSVITNDHRNKHRSRAVPSEMSDSTTPTADQPQIPANKLKRKRRSTSEGSSGTSRRSSVSRSVSIDSRHSSTVSSATSTRSSVRLRRQAASAAVFESRCRYLHNIKPCEVVMVRHPVVEICARAMLETGQCTFKVLARAPQQTCPVVSSNTATSNNNNRDTNKAGKQLEANEEN